MGLLGSCVSVSGCVYVAVFVFFFFQAEDGIRDRTVTGVQTCALPILNLVDLIEANPKTKFILFHGGFPWVGEMGVIAQKNWQHVWIDSVWLPELSYSTAKRAFHEWLDAFPSNRLMWGGDCNHAEGIYGATEFHRRCIAEVLAEKVTAGDLTEEHALA